MLNLCFTVARQEDKASDSISELVFAVKHRRALSESKSHSFRKKSGSDGELDVFEPSSMKNSEDVFLDRRNSCSGMISTMKNIRENPREKNKSKKPKKSILHAIMK